MLAKSIDDIIADLQTKWAQANITNFNNGGIAQTMLEGIADVGQDLYSFAIQASLQGNASTATGDFLKAKAMDRLVVKNEGEKAVRKVNVTRNSTSGNLTITKDSILQSGEDSSGSRYRFFVDQDYTLLDGESKIEILATAEAIGTAYNLPADTVVYWGSAVSGIDEIEDDLDDRIYSEGSNEDSAARLYRRFMLAWDAITTGSTASAYLGWCLADSRVAQAWIDWNGPRGEGTIDIYVVGTAGSPSVALLQALRDDIIGTSPDYDDGKRPYGDDVWIHGPAEQAVAITATVQVYTGTNTTTLDVELKATLAAYFSPTGDELYTWLRPITVSRKVVYVQLVEIIMRPTGVYNVAFTTPTADQDTPQGTLPTLGTVTLTYEEVSA